MHAEEGSQQHRLDRDNEHHFHDAPGLGLHSPGWLQKARISCTRPIFWRADNIHRRLIRLESERHPPIHPFLSVVFAILSRQGRGRQFVQVVHPFGTRGALTHHGFPKMKPPLFSLLALMYQMLSAEVLDQQKSHALSSKGWIEHARVSTILISLKH